MHNTLVFKVNDEEISVKDLDRIFQSVNGFGTIRYNTPIGTPIEADYTYGHDYTTVRLNSKCDTVSLRGTSDAALQAALQLQENIPSPLRVIDTDYSFDLILSDFKNLDELLAAIDQARTR